MKLQDLREVYAMSKCEYEFHQLDHPKLQAALDVVRLVWAVKVASIWCRYFGHRVERSGWAGPNGAGENLDCCRCGHGQSITYY